jgi:hypothetical protein
MRVVDLTGQRFGLLTVVDRRGSIGGEAAWRSRCDCGGENVTRGSLLRKGKTKSCGCIVIHHGAITHGHAAHGATPSRAYQTWRQMRARCSNPKHHNFPRYGGRGVAVCERWQSFENFLADMGERPAGTSLDRIDNDRGYEPGNCRWATTADQNRNRSDTRRLTIGNRTMSTSEWAHENGLLPQTVYKRLNSGWSVVDAVSRPSRRPYAVGGRHAQ